MGRTAFASPEVSREHDAADREQRERRPQGNDPGEPVRPSAERRRREQHVPERRDHQRQRDDLPDQTRCVSGRERQARQGIGAAPCRKEDCTAVAQEERRNQHVEKRWQEQGCSQRQQRTSEMGKVAVEAGTPDDAELKGRPSERRYRRGRDRLQRPESGNSIMVRERDHGRLQGAKPDQGCERAEPVAAQQEHGKHERQDESGYERQGQARHHGTLYGPKPDLGRPETGSRTRMPVPASIVPLNLIDTGGKR